ncbi:MAG: pyridoxine 5'-phosphate synthase, partial [Verrucomicrobia bacterium]|nr:pyridoxine 5'-phosphate synthase [Verrucomicrobiota bacterium]
MIRLGVNIDHVATLRQARYRNHTAASAPEPDPLLAARICMGAGAHSLTVHLREDRRHIQDRDLEVLRRTVQVKLNLEGSIDAEMVAIACRVRPDQVTLVPERREEVTTEGGLDLLSHRAAVAAAVGRLHDAGIPVSLFIDPAPAAI